MPSKTNEQALESAIEKSLAGISTEDIKNGIAEPLGEYITKQHYYVGSNQDFNPKYGFDEKRLWHFLEATHQVELAKLQRSGDWKIKILDRLDRLIKKYGLLHILKKGMEVDDASFTFFYESPLASSSQSVKDNFAANEFSVTRQVTYNLDNTREEIDMVIFLNGLPLATMELKNHWTGQTAKFQGIKQYKQDRDIKQPLLNFGRCLVHFAVDTDEVYMTTKLAGKSTFFLPFNKGANNGKGNPVNPDGHKTAYLWEEVFQKESWANIIQHFILLDGKKTDSLSKKTMFFPRYHQLNVVRSLIKDVSEEGIGKTYLIQHSAGSGKTNSITWLGYQLIETYPINQNVKGARGLETPMFDSVIVVTDRTILDKQLRDNISSFSEVKNIVAPAKSSKDLKEALEQGKKIIITTIQKFPFIVDGIADLSEKQFAVIIDEAHSSQSGSAAGKMNQAMGFKEAQEEDEGLDGQDKILAIMKAKKMKGNASYLAFTATPKAATLERFGTQQEDGSFDPFHLYSMKQAIEEGFILDVLSNYTTFKSYYEIAKSTAEDPLFDTKAAQKKLRAYVESDKKTIRSKADIMLEHFMSNVVKTKRLKGKAKGMVVTQNIENAIRYYQAINDILGELGNPFKVIVAFSGTKTVDGIDYTEADINGFTDKDTKAKFETDEYRLLVVANKYLTGFDQPKLCSMYIDKKMQGVLAVQGLSRLNRSAPKYGKRTEDIFILDFFNKVEEMQASFTPFYTETTLKEATDPNVLHELKDTLDDSGIYEWSEVEDFCDKYFSNVDAQELSPIIDTVAYRFTDELELEDEVKKDIKVKAKHFVKVYGQLAAIIPFENIKWEKLFWFLKFLIPKLKVDEGSMTVLDGLLESVDLSTYGLERVKLGVSIELNEGEGELAPTNSNPRGAHAEEEKEVLGEIIKSFNEKWFNGWESTSEEQRVKLLTLKEQIEAHDDFQTKVANNPDKQTKNLAFKKILDEVMSQQRRKELELYKLYAKDNTFNQSLIESMKRLTKV